MGWQRSQMGPGVGGGQGELEFFFFAKRIYPPGNEYISHQWVVGNSSSQLPLDGICDRSQEGNYLWIPSWERSHIPSQPALLIFCRWFSPFPVWWDMDSFPGGYAGPLKLNMAPENQPGKEMNRSWKPSWLQLPAVKLLGCRKRCNHKGKGKTSGAVFFFYAFLFCVHTPKTLSRFPCWLFCFLHIVLKPPRKPMIFERVSSATPYIHHCKLSTPP